MTIPIAKPVVSEEAENAVRDVLNSGMLADGEVVRAFEEEFADYVGVDHAVATSSGTTALHAMLEAAGVGEGDAVVTTAFSFVASANAIVHAGAEPVFVDIREGTFNLDPEAVRSVLRRRDDVVAVLAVHLYGLPAAMDKLTDLTDEYDVMLFEDAAQAHGATFRGEMAGALADAAAFSFYPTKNMTTGEGGMITTDNPELAERAKQLVDHGRAGRYRHELVGYNYRMTNIGAAIGRDQLERLSGWVRRRRENASTLTRGLADNPAVTPPHAPEESKHAFHQYTIQVADREGLRRGVAERNVETGVYYPVTIPQQPAYKKQIATPRATDASKTVLSLPVHPGITEEEVQKIVTAVNEVTRTNG